MIALMVPLIAVNVRHAALRSPRASRPRVTGDVVVGWAVVWAGAGILLGLGAWLLPRAIGELAAVGLVTGLAVGWQFSAIKRRSVARCHRLLAPPLDRRRSRRVCGRYGLGLGRDCALSCWPLMLLMAVAAHQPLVIASSVGVAWYERRRRPHHDPATTGTSLVIAATGATALLVASLR
jgi:predicted metal-binding membrane protein